ncbi:MAG: WD40/YVTN/BNR-like repeat-containing protein [bacterium]
MRARILIASLAVFLLLGAVVVYRRESSSSGVAAPVSVSPGRPQIGLAVDPRNGDLLKAASAQLFRSKDGGRRWVPLPLPARFASTGVSQVVVNPEKPDVIYAAGPGAGVLMSRDSGATWQQINTGLSSTDVEALAIHASRRATLFVSLRGKGMYRTEDSGQRWQRMDGGPAAQPVLALAHSPLEGSMNTGWLYAGTKEGPYISMDCF